MKHIIKPLIIFSLTFTLENIEAELKCPLFRSYVFGKILVSL